MGIRFVLAAEMLIKFGGGGGGDMIVEVIRFDVFSFLISPQVLDEGAMEE